MRTSLPIAVVAGLALSAALTGCSTSGTSAPKTTTNVDTYLAGAHCFDNAIDASGNIWVANGGNGTPGTAPGDSNITKLSPSGAVIGTYVAGSFPIGMAIDKTGDVWVENYGNRTPGTAPGDSNVTKLSPSGVVLGTYVVGSYPAGGIAIDASGNVWVSNWGTAVNTPGTPGNSSR